MQIRPDKMRILTLHNYTGNYAFGGEGKVFEDETRLLRDHGHEVCQYKCTNSEIMEAKLHKKIKAFINAPWSKSSYRTNQETIEKFKPDIMHVHNFFFILSPSIFRAAKDAGIPTVVTLHNFRFISPCSQLLRNGQICEICLNKNPWRIMLYRCYRKSFMANLFRYRIYYWGKKKYRWINDIDSFIALTEFGREKYIEGGLPAEKIYVKPNFIDDPITGGKNAPNGHGAIFVGRISKEKGLKTLMQAWLNVDYPLTVVGDGPQMAEIKSIAPKNVLFVGEKSNEEVMRAIQEASFMVFPSELYEGFPLTILEAMAAGRAVIASDLGPRGEMVHDKKTGLLFRAGDPDDLGEKAKYLADHPLHCTEMGRAARQEYLEKYTEKINYRMLIEIYEQTIKRTANSGKHSSM